MRLEVYVLKKDIIFITGYAKLPNGITVTELYNEMVMGVILNRHSGEIKDVECSFITSTAKKYTRELLIGRNLNDAKEIMRDIEDNYFGMAKKSFMAVLMNCYERYKMISRENEKG